MKVPQLTFTRFIAAILVIFFHHYRETALFLNANVFVGFFYVLSGFVLVVSQKSEFTENKDFTVFYLNRFARIYPVYLLATLLFVLVHQYVGRDIVLNMAGVQSFFPNHAMSYNFPSWSISVELFFYFCFPFLVRYLFHKYSLNVVLWVTFAFWLVSQVFCSIIFYSDAYAQSTAVKHFLWYNPLNHINQFICGCALALLFKKNYQRWTGNHDVMVLLLAALIFCYLSFFKSSLNIRDQNGLLVIFFAPLILLLSLNTGLITKVFSHRFLVLAGEISFGLYILAEPVFDGMQYLSSLFLFPAAASLPFKLAVLAVVSYVVYVFFEKPLQHKIKQAGMKLLQTNFTLLKSTKEKPAVPIGPHPDPISSTVE